MPLNWRGRTKCFLFFDAEFEDISNNKLKLLTFTEPWLMAVKEKIIYDPKDLTKYKTNNPSHVFVQWLAKCHEEHDEEFSFSERLLSLENESRWNYVDEKNKVDRYPLYKTMNVGAASQALTITTGALIRLALSGGRGRARKEEVFARVVAFLATHEPIDVNTPVTYSKVPYLATYSAYLAPM